MYWLWCSSLMECLSVYKEKSPRPWWAWALAGINHQNDIYQKYPVILGLPREGLTRAVINFLTWMRYGPAHSTHTLRTVVAILYIYTVLRLRHPIHSFLTTSCLGECTEAGLAMSEMLVFSSRRLHVPRRKRPSAVVAQREFGYNFFFSH